MNSLFLPQKIAVRTGLTQVYGGIEVLVIRSSCNGFWRTRDTSVVTVPPSLCLSANLNPETAKRRWDTLVLVEELGGRRDSSPFILREKVQRFTSPFLLSVSCTLVVLGSRSPDGSRPTRLLKTRKILQKFLI